VDEDDELRLKREQEDGKEVSWSREEMLKASIAAATPERKQKVRGVVAWLARQAGADPTR
jgi:hypothetical protein